jgi:hypothetical protein
VASKAKAKIPVRFERSRSLSSKVDPLAQHLRKAVVEKLDAWVESVPRPDEPLIGSANGNMPPLSPRDIVRHVKKRTPTGERILENWVDLVVKHIKDAPVL